MGLSKKYDNLFAQYGELIPVDYLRSLGYWESNLNPKLAEPSSGWGLLQVVEEVRGDFNKAHPNSRYTRSDMLKPEPNVRVACWLLNIIQKQWTKNPGDGFPGLAADWDSDTWVELFTAGWNSGWSRYGLPKVVRYMVTQGVIERGDTPKLSTLARYAKSSGSVFAKYADWNRTYSWAPKVVSTFRTEQSRVSTPPGVPVNRHSDSRTIKILQSIQAKVQQLDKEVDAAITEISGD
jgi:soluble lytic murein transglycosylase-like protein